MRRVERVTEGIANEEPVYGHTHNSERVDAAQLDPHASEAGFSDSFSSR